jgi:hypothetical protein
MGDLSKRLSEKDILKGFEKIAIQVVKDNKEHFLQYNSILVNGEYESDRETVRSVFKKYFNGKNIDFVGLLGLRYLEDSEDFLGPIKIKGAHYDLDEGMFFSDDGINVIKTILDLIKIEYECKYCLKRPACKVTEKYDECDGAKELLYNNYYYCIIKDIIRHSWTN